MGQLGFVSILLLMAGMMVAAWIAVRCGIRASIDKERNGEEGSGRLAKDIET
jgi:hypothetical protein